jgi:hypothetical protein
VLLLITSSFASLFFFFIGIWCYSLKSASPE